MKHRWSRLEAVVHGYRFIGLRYKTEDFYKDIAEDVETRFDTSGFEFNRPADWEEQKGHLIDER